MAALTPAHPGSLAPESRELLAALGGRELADDLYLAGSAALALYLGHRPVRGLDLMSLSNRLAGAERRDLLQHLLEIDPAARVETARDGFLFLRAGGAALKLFYYPYPLVDPEQRFNGVAVASAVDLGLMKLGAIISRGARRDFLDLYLLCRKVPLAELLERAPEKFGHVRDFPLQALKGLADLSQLGDEPLPRLTAPVAWAEIDDWLRASVRELGRTRLGLE